MADSFKSCSVVDCKGNSHYSAYGSSGLCCSHYKRKKKTGDPLGSQRKEGPAIGWLKAHVAHSSDDCLAWPFSRGLQGYGSVRLEQKTYLAHRLMCMLAHGLPDGKLDAAHSCGKGHEGCVNPSHLRWATRAINCADKLGHGTDNRGEKSPLSKLLKSEVEEIRSLRGHMTQPEIAAIYGIVQSNVSKIQTGDSWSWL
jgi:hypothetical protein